MMRAALAVSAVIAGPGLAQDMQELCVIERTCALGDTCKPSDAQFGLNTFFGEVKGPDRYEVIWNGEPVAALEEHQGHIFAWTAGPDEDKRSFALAYLYNSSMPDPAMAEFSLTESRIFGRVSDTLIHIGTCRERGN